MDSAWCFNRSTGASFAREGEEGGTAGGEEKKGRRERGKNLGVE
jgi:hypothetical protein